MVRIRAAAPLVALSLLLGACGGSEEGANAKRYSGESKRVAAVVDDLQGASRSGDAKHICDDIFTDKLAGTISVRAGSTCETRVKKQQVNKSAKLTVLSLSLARGTTAQVLVREQNGHRTRLTLVKQDGDWRIDSIFP